MGRARDCGIVVVISVCSNCVGDVPALHIGMNRCGSRNVPQVCIYTTGNSSVSKNCYLKNKDYLSISLDTNTQGCEELLCTM